MQLKHKKGVVTTPFLLYQLYNQFSNIEKLCKVDFLKKLLNHYFCISSSHCIYYIRATLSLPSAYEKA